MQIQTPTAVTSSVSSFDSLSTRARQGAGRSLPGWAIGASVLVSLVAAVAMAQAWSADRTLEDGLHAFEQRVTGGGLAEVGTAAAGSPADVLARRYLGALQPEVRQGISDQVRAEQREGVTPVGKDAFVLRRLELYEAALQQAGKIGAARAR